MYGIISNDKLEKLYTTYGEPAFHDTNDDIVGSLLRASRLSLDTIILDLGPLDGLGVIGAIHRYRIQRPDTRIIVLAPGRQPGDTTIAGIVGTGVYDIVAPRDDEDIVAHVVAAVKAGPATYAQAARWAVGSGQGIAVNQIGIGDNGPNLNHNNSRPSPPAGSTTVIRRPLGLTTVAVAALDSGAGASFISLAVAAHLARARNRTILVEWPESKELSRGQSSQYSPYVQWMRKSPESHTVQGREIQIARVAGFDIFLDACSYRGIDYIFPLISDYQYMVLDLGGLNQVKSAEMNRASLPILVASAAPYRFTNMLSLISNSTSSHFVSNISTWTLALNLADESSSSTKQMKQELSRYFRSVVPVPYFSDPLTDDKADVIQALVDRVLPEPITSRARTPLWNKIAERRWSFENRRRRRIRMDKGDE